MCEINMPALAANAAQPQQPTDSSNRKKVIISVDTTCNIPVFYHFLNNIRTLPSVKMKRDSISIGCTTVTPLVLTELLALYNKEFPSQDKEVTIQ